MLGRELLGEDAVVASSAGVAEVQKYCIFKISRNSSKITTATNSTTHVTSQPPTSSRGQCSSLPLSLNTAGEYTIVPVAADVATVCMSSVAATAGLPKLSTASLFAPAASSARTHSTRPNCGACGVDCIAGEAWWKRRAHLRSQVQSGRLCDVVGFVWVSATGTRRIRGEVG
jgi:hypothetical protein